MRLKPGFIIREVCDEYVIIPTGTTALEFNGLLTVNEIGVELWKLLEEEVTFNQLVEHVLDEYEVDEQTATKDVKEFVDYLMNIQVITDE